MSVFGPKEPCCGRADEKGEGSEDSGEAKGGKAGAGEVEESRHGEGIVADAAVGEQVADVGNEGDVARGPEAIGEGERDGDAEDGEGGMGCGDPAAGEFCLRVCSGEGLLRAFEGGGDEDEEWEVRRKGVVLLIGGEGEEGKDERSKDAEEECGALREGGGEKEWRAMGGAELALAKFVDEEDEESDEDCEEVGNVEGVAEEDTYCDYGEGLPVGDAVGEGVVLVEAAEAGGGLAEEDSAKEGPREEPYEMEAPVEVAGELVVVHRVALAEEAEEVLVDEVEPEEAVAVHAASVAESGEDVPWGSDEEEEQSAGEGFEGAPVFCSRW